MKFNVDFRRLSALSAKTGRFAVAFNPQIVAVTGRYGRLVEAKFGFPGLFPASVGISFLSLFVSKFGFLTGKIWKQTKI